MAEEDLFDGVQAIADAGGVEGFVREVMAEVQTTALGTIEERGIVEDQQAFAVFNETLSAVLERRLRRDVKVQYLQLLLASVVSRSGISAEDLRQAERETNAAVQALGIRRGKFVCEAISRIKDGQ